MNLPRERVNLFVRHLSCHSTLVTSFFFVIILISGYIPFLFIESPRLLAAHRSATDAIDSSTGAAASSSAGGTLSEDAASIYMREMFLEFFLRSASEEERVLEPWPWLATKVRVGRRGERGRATS